MAKKQKLLTTNSGRPRRCIGAAVRSVSQKPRLRPGAEAETGPVHRVLFKSDGSAIPTERHLKLRATNHQNQT